MAETSNVRNVTEGPLASSLAYVFDQLAAMGVKRQSTDCIRDTFAEYRRQRVNDESHRSVPRKRVRLSAETPSTMNAMSSGPVPSVGKSDLYSILHAAVLNTPGARKADDDAKG